MILHTPPQKHRWSRNHQKRCLQQKQQKPRLQQQCPKKVPKYGSLSTDFEVSNGEYGDPICTACTATNCDNDLNQSHADIGFT